MSRFLSKDWLIFDLIGCKMIKIKSQPISEELMDNQPMMEATSDDKLWALLAYVLTPIVPVIILLMEDKKNRPFIRAHNAQALVIGVVNFLLGIFWGIQAYNGKMVEIPVVSNFVRQQGWA
jgi:uncharacterized membrane protein